MLPPRARCWIAGWGKPPQAHTGENGEGNIRVVIRHIVDGRDEPLDAKVIDATPVRHEDGDED